MNIVNKPELSLVCVSNNLEPDQSGQIYEIEPNQYLNEKYPNLCIIPMIHNVDIHKTENVPLVVINLSTEEIYLLKGDYRFYTKLISRYIGDSNCDLHRTLTYHIIG